MKKLKLACLLSGGKDSVLALHIAAKVHNVTCAITLKSLNKDSYMFHTPNIDLVDFQAQALNTPLVKHPTKGLPEQELKDLHAAIKKAKEQYEIQGVVTGAVGSVYQATRIQKICHELKLVCFNPLWLMNEKELLDNIIELKMDVRIGAIAAYPFDERMLGKKLTTKLIDELLQMQNKYGIHPAGEGGEFESIVLDAPLFKQRIKVIKHNTTYNANQGTWNIEECKLTKK